MSVSRVVLIFSVYEAEHYLFKGFIQRRVLS